jgi:hypothetical protein
VTSSRTKGEEYLLERALYRRLSTGEIANPEFLKFAFPPRYHYDVLRALDYLRAAGSQTEARIADAVDIVRSKRQANGRWFLDASYDESLAPTLNESVNMPSRWITLRALRVLHWYDRSFSHIA